MLNETFYVIFKHRAIVKVRYLKCFNIFFEWSCEVRAKREPSSEMSHSKTSIRFFSCKILRKNLPRFVAFSSQSWITKGSYAIWDISIMKSSCKNLRTFPDLLLFLHRVVAYFKGLCHT